MADGVCHIGCPTLGVPHVKESRVSDSPVSAPIDIIAEEEIMHVLEIVSRRDKVPEEAEEVLELPMQVAEDFTRRTHGDEARVRPELHKKVGASHKWERMGLRDTLWGKGMVL